MEIYVRVVNNGLDFILFLFFFVLSFEFLVSDLDESVICNTEKVVEGPETNNNIQHSNNILALWQAHIL